MKNLFIMLMGVLILSSFSQHSPNYEVKWGPFCEADGNKFREVYSIGIADDHYYLVSQPFGKSTLLEYDFQHNLISKKPLNLKYQSQNIGFYQFVTTATGTFGYTSIVKKKENTEKVFISKFQEGNFTKVEKPYSFKIKVGDDKYGELTDPILSMNDEHVGFISYKESSKKSELNFRVLVFNSDFQFQWAKTIVFPFLEKSSKFISTHLGDDGSYYTVVRTERGKPEKGVQYYDNYLYKINETGIVKSHKFDLHDIIPSSMRVMYNEGKKEIVAYGMYVDDAKHYGIKGVFFYKLDNDLNFSLKNTSAFDQSFLEAVNKDRKLDNDGGLDMFFNIRHAIIHSDDSYSFIAENVHERGHYREQNGIDQLIYTTYYSEEIILPRFHSNGDLKSLELIDKSFFSSFETTTSYTFGHYGDNIYLLYNDFKKKSERQELKASGTKGGKWARFTDLAVIDDTGKILHNETLFSNNDITSEFSPNLSMHNDDVIILGGVVTKPTTVKLDPVSNHHYQFGTLRLD